MNNFFDGLVSATEVFITSLVLTELNIFIEEWVINKQNQKKGFFKRGLSQIRSLFRNPTSGSDLVWGFSAYVPYYFAIGLIPGLSNKAIFDLDESLLIFIFIMTALPMALFATESSLGFGFKERVKERAMATQGTLLLLAVNLFVVTGQSNISKIIAQNKNWLIIDNPITILLFFGILISIYSMTQQKAFSSTMEMRQSGKQISFLNRWKTGWLIFLCTVFLGGGSLIIWALVIGVNIVSVTIATAFSKLKEEQTEELVLWELGPIAVFVLLVTLAVLGGKG